MTTPDETVTLSPSDLFLAPELSEDRASQYPAARGFRDPAAADRNLQLMADDLVSRQALGSLAAVLLDCLSLTPDPDAALVGFSRYLATRTPKSSFLRYLHDDPRGLQVLTQVLGTSPFLSEILIRNPEYFHWLQHELGRSVPDRLDYAEELEGLLANARGAGQLDALKRLKRREMLRIASRDILGKETVPSATAQVSNLADLVAEGALRIVSEESLERAGLDTLPGMFAVIGMGKLGGQELNYSSDIDLIYVYDSDEPDDPDGHAFFQKLGRKLTSALTEYSGESYLYRVDLRLRPMGKRGSIAYSLAQCRQYYETWGETFERFALIKARSIAGDASLGRRFVEIVRPFVYRRYLDHAALEEMFRHKSRMDRENLRRGETERNVKVGRGGIRELELFTQVLQLLYGADRPELQEPNTLAALDRLRDAGLVSDSVHDDLTQAYVFLRTVEHRLQIVQERQTHSLSEADTEREIFARRMGFETFDGLEAKLRTQRDRVHDVYRSLFERSKADANFHGRQFFRILSGELSEREALAHLVETYQVRDAAKVLEVVRALDEAPSIVHAKSATRNVLANLLATLLQQVEQRVQPDQILNRLEQVASHTGAATSFFRSLLENNQLRETLVAVLDAGDLPAQRLARHPELLDFLVLPAADLGTLRGAVGASLDRMDNVGTPERMSQVRRLKSIEETKALFEWLAGGTLETLQDKLSTLADCCIERVAQWHLVEPSGARLEADSWAVLALGKLGSRELTIHSDLDLVFLYEGDPQDAETFARCQSRVREVQEFLEQPTDQGVAYRMDTRLRPEGTKGALAMPRQAFERYLKNRAEIWERLAWTRYRFLAGSPEMAASLDAAVTGFVYASWDRRIPSSMDRIRVRMERELAREASQARFDFKVGKGGLADLDFLVQLIQVHEGHERPEFRVAGTRHMLAQLPSTPFLDAQDAERLRHAHRFLRTLEALARIEADSSVSWISTDAERLESTGRRLGLSPPSGPALLDRYRQVTDEVRAIYTKVVERLQGKGG